MRYRFQRTTLIAAGCFALIIGIALVSYGFSLNGFWLFLLAPCAFLIRKRTLFALPALILAGIIIGLWRGSAVWQQRAQYKDYFDKKVTYTVRALEDGVYGDRAQMEFAANNVSVNGVKLPGKVSVRGFGAPAVYRGDILEVTGKLREGKGSVQGYISFAELKVINHSFSSFDTVRRNFVAGSQSALPSPHASLGMGLLIGQRNLLPDELNDSLGRVGLAHIVAVSGYNLTILVNLVRRVTGKRSKYQSIAFSFLLITLFLVMSGLSPSIIRAAIVSVLSLLAWFYGRTVKPVTLIAIAAAITGFAQPLYVWGDLGWYLSFLAFFGVLVAAPAILRRWYKQRKPHPIVAVFAETICAQLLTAPIIMLVFGQFSVIGFLANIAVVPLIPYAMALTLVAGLGGMLVPFISGWFALPGRYLLSYVVDVVRMLDRVPFAAIELKITALQMSLLYILIGLVVWSLHRKSDKITLVEKDF